MSCANCGHADDPYHGHKEFDHENDEIYHEDNPCTYEDCNCMEFKEAED